METKKNEAQAKPAEVKKRKRYRPSLGQMRELSRKLAEAEETVHNLVQDCDAWRDKYRKLAERKDAEAVAKERDTLYNQLCQALTENKRLKKAVTDCNQLTLDLKGEVKRLRSRNLIERIMNW